MATIDINQLIQESLNKADSDRVINESAGDVDFESIQDKMKDVLESRSGAGGTSDSTWNRFAKQVGEQKKSQRENAKYAGSAQAGVGSGGTTPSSLRFKGRSVAKDVSANKGKYGAAAGGAAALGGAAAIAAKLAAAKNKAQAGMDTVKDVAADAKEKVASKAGGLASKASDIMSNIPGGGKTAAATAAALGAGLAAKRFLKKKK